MLLTHTYSLFIWEGGSEELIERDMKGSGQGIILGTIHVFARRD